MALRTWVSDAVRGPIGIALLILALIALPLNVVAIMNLAGMSWWSATLTVIAMQVVPLLGQLTSIALTFIGAYFLVDAGWDWQRASQDRNARMISLSDLTPAQLAGYKVKIVESFEKICHEELKATVVGPDAKPPEQATRQCQCEAREVAGIITKADIIEQGATGKLPDDFKARRDAAIGVNCRSENQQR
jgi:hypothetical protein